MMTLTVYASSADEVKKRLDRLAKKAAGYKVPFSYEVGEEYPKTVRVLAVGPDGIAHEVERHTVAAVDFTVECDGLIKANGWTVCAKIEHGEKGNIVTGFGNRAIRPEWYTVAPNCDHCHVNRFRSVTFICENEAGEIRQVGRTCLKDYTGISPSTAAMWAEVQDLVDTGFDCTTDEWAERKSAQMYEVSTVLAHAYDLIKEFGYRKSDESMSTREKIGDRLRSGARPSDEGLKNATVYIRWLSDLDAAIKEEKTIATVGDIERNCIPLALSGFAKMSHVGRLAYIPIAHKRYLERVEQEEAKEAARKAAAETSAYVGGIGERLLVKLATAELITSWDGMYGTTWLYRFTDESGNVFIWYASRPCEAEGGTTIKATVKDHKERDGVKQTILTRCQVAA